MFATAVSLAVSAIPEGLPVVLTLVLATGVWRMARRNALVKKLQAVEALGAARIIAVDKTGTLTKNEMVVREVIIGGKVFEIEGSGYAPVGEIKLRGKKCAVENHPELKLAAKIAALAASAQAIFLEEQGIWKVSGDPTEAALAVFAKKIGVIKEDIAPDDAVVDDRPFDYKTKYRMLAIREGKTLFAAIAGAPEVLLTSASHELRDDKHVKMTAERRQELLAEFSEISQRGLRVVGFGYIEKPLPRKEAATGDIGEMTIAGFFAMEDALREEVPEAMRRAHEAGIRVVMITGDYKLTAMAIAKEAGILKDKDRVVTGDELAALDEKGLASIIHEVTVFARVTPEDKLKIVQAYRAAGLTIAMTGDGVNDAPSLVAADLGVAMGKIGTEVSKEAADIVLLDDNFGSIVAAVEEGRSIFKTIKKVLLYLFSTSMGEVLALAGAIVLNVPLPILPRQILWLNLVTDGFLTVALAMEPKEKDLLRGKFVKPNRYLIDKDMVVRSIIMSGVMMVGTLYLFKDYYQTDLIKAQTIALCVLAVYQWFNAWNCRSDRDSIALQNPFANWWLIAATIIVVVLQVAATTVPILQDTLQLVPLTAYEWTMVVLVALTIIIAEEIRKLVARVVRERNSARAAT
jgi:Ca2+-transporting ATPase